MKDEDPFLEIAALLRSRTPDLPPPPGLEARILRALDSRRRPAAIRWRWIAAPAALAGCIVLAPLLRRPAPASGPQHLVRKTVLALPVISPPDLALSRVLAGNPIQSEADAVRRDARRAGGFLIDCLPSLAGNDE